MVLKLTSEDGVVKPAGIAQIHSNRMLESELIIY